MGEKPGVLVCGGEKDVGGRVVTGRAVGGGGGRSDVEDTREPKHWMVSWKVEVVESEMERVGGRW